MLTAAAITALVTASNDTKKPADLTPEQKAELPTWAVQIIEEAKENSEVEQHRKTGRENTRGR